MKVALLSRNRNLHSTRRLLQEAKKKRIECNVIDPLECQLIVQRGHNEILYGGKILPHFDAILPRIGASITDYGISVVKQFEILGTRSLNSSQGIAESRDKMRCLQILSAAGIPVPTSILTRHPRALRKLVERLGGLPTVLKVLRGTQGLGVMLMTVPISLKTVLDAFKGLEQDVLLQEFISEGSGRDHRVFVIGDQVVASMTRTAAEGDFRSNIHRGGKGNWADLPKAYKQLALKAAHKLKLQVAGVDLIESRHGPLVLEVNSSPGFEGIERATGLNIAEKIVRQLGIAARRKSTR